MKNFEMPEKVALDCVGDTEISTVKLNSAAFGSDQYETCMFYDNGDSNVVARYKTLAEALASHAHIVAHEKNHLVARMRLFGG